MKKCGIYSITNIINGKMIIGLSSNINKRWYNYKSRLKQNKHENPHLQNAWNKYGEKNFKFEIILLCSVEKLNKEEIRLIKEYNTTNAHYGYNINEGGNRPKASKKTKKKMREAHLGIKLSEEHKQKISKANLGKKQSKETKRKIRKANLGKKLSEETKQKIRKVNLGKKLSEESKQKIRKAKTGEIPWIKGKRMSEEAKQKIKISNLGKKLSEETKRKISQKMIKIWQKKINKIKQNSG